MPSLGRGCRLPASARDLAQAGHARSPSETPAERPHPPGTPPRRRSRAGGKLGGAERLGVINMRLSFQASAGAVVLALLAALAPGLAAAPALSGGDKPATVTVGGRPLSADTDHIVAFTRGKTLYVCVDDLKAMVSGSMTHTGNQYTVHSFKGDTNSKTYQFAVGSAKVIAAGKPVELSAPIISAYGHVYIPLSFFGSGAVRTHAKISADARSGDIILPPGLM